MDTNRKSHAIPGFKVMKWLRKIREESYRLRQENPEQYVAEMESARRVVQEKMRAQALKEEDTVNYLL